MRTVYQNGCEMAGWTQWERYEEREILEIDLGVFFLASGGTAITEL